MLLRVGVAVMAFALIVATGVALAVSLRDDEPEEQVVAAEPAAKPSAPETQPEARVELDIPDEEPEPQPRPEPESRPEPGPEPQSEPERQPEPELRAENPEPEPAASNEPVDKNEPAPRSAPQPESEPEPEPEPERGAGPVVAEDWPEPDGGEIRAASKPRRYDWVPGAAMTLTVRNIGIYNAPVMGNDSQRALDNGIVHVPETSLPWDDTPQTNVYLAGHKLGWPGTGSRMIFYNLGDLQRGNEVVLEDRRGNRYKYRVSETFVVGPYDSWVMGQVRNRDMVTLQTCTGPGFSQRLIVRADRV